MNNNPKRALDARARAIFPALDRLSVIVVAIVGIGIGLGLGGCSSGTRPANPNGIASAMYPTPELGQRFGTVLRASQAAPAADGGAQADLVIALDHTGKTLSTRARLDEGAFAQGDRVIIEPQRDGAVNILKAGHARAEPLYPVFRKPGASKRIFTKEELALDRESNGALPTDLAGLEVKPKKKAPGAP